MPIYATEAQTRLCAQIVDAGGTAIIPNLRGAYITSRAAERRGLIVATPPRYEVTGLGRVAAQLTGPCTATPDQPCDGWHPPGQRPPCTGITLPTPRNPLAWVWQPEPPAWALTDGVEHHGYALRSGDDGEHQWTPADRDGNPLGGPRPLRDLAVLAAETHLRTGPHPTVLRSVFPGWKPPPPPAPELPPAAQRWLDQTAPAPTPEPDAQAEAVLRLWWELTHPDRLGGYVHVFREMGPGRRRLAFRLLADRDEVDPWLVDRTITDGICAEWDQRHRPVPVGG